MLKCKLNGKFNYVLYVTGKIYSVIQ